MSAHDPVSPSTQEIDPPGADYAARRDGKAPGQSPIAVAVETPERSDTKRSPLVALRHRDFRLYWAGGFISQVGTQMRTVAVGVQIWDLTHSYAAVGLLGLAKLVPLLCLSLFGGVIADAVDLRRLHVLTQLTMALSSVVLALSTQSGWVSPLLIYGISAVSAAALAFDNPTRSAFIPNLVPREHLPNALSLNIIVWQVATTIGPVVAGRFLGYGSLGLALLYWIDAVSFLAVVVAVILMRTRFQKAETRDVSLRAALDGFRFLR